MLYVAFEWLSNEFSFRWRQRTEAAWSLHDVSIRKLFRFHLKCVGWFDSTWEHKIQSNGTASNELTDNQYVCCIVSIEMNILQLLNGNSISSSHSYKVNGTVCCSKHAISLNILLISLNSGFYFSEFRLRDAMIAQKVKIRATARKIRHIYQSLIFIWDCRHSFRRRPKHTYTQTTSQIVTMNFNQDPWQFIFIIHIYHFD